MAMEGETALLDTKKQNLYSRQSAAIGKVFQHIVHSTAINGQWLQSNL